MVDTLTQHGGPESDGPSVVAPKARRAPAGQRHGRIPALDGLRGIAVVGVVLYHGGHLRGGFLGVDLFFVLSGYLITTVLLRSVRPDGSIGLKRFWSRRARRLLPALIVLLVVVLPVYAHWFATPTDLDPVRYDGLGSLFYVTNWAQILHGQSYFTVTLADSPIRHLWSLAVEEQFYLVWPLVVVAAVRRGGARTVFVVASVLGLASAAITIGLGLTRAVSFNSIYLGTHTRAAGLLAGAALAAWFAIHGAPRSEAAQRRLQGAAAVAVVVLGAMWMTLRVTQQSLYVGGLALSAIAGTVLVASAATSTDGPLIRVLSVRPLRMLGTISYGIYLWSWPITQLVSERHTPLRGWTLLIVQVILTVDIAAASWLVLERPILRGAIRPPWSARALTFGAVAAAVAVIAATAGAVAAPSTSVSTAGYAMSKVDGAPRLLVVGDSLPGRIAQEGIIPQRDLLGVSTVDRTVAGCILLRSVGIVKGREGNIREDVHPCDDGWGHLVERFHPDVVLMMFGEFPNDEVEIDGHFELPCTAAYQRAERAKLAKAFDELTAGGARLVISTAPGSSVSWVLAGMPPGMNDRVGCMNRLYREVAAQHSGVDVVDLASYVCPPGERCKERIDGINLRQDTIHFRGAAAELVARWLIAKVFGTKQVAAPPAATTAPKAPFCGQLALLQKNLGQFNATTFGAPGSAERDALIRAMRPLPPAFESSAPPELRADITSLVDGWDALLDRVAALPAKPTDAQYVAALAAVGAPVAHLGSWSATNCG